MVSARLFGPVTVTDSAPGVLTQIRSSSGPAVDRHVASEVDEASASSRGIILVVLAGWTLLALLETAKEWVGWRERGSPRGWGTVAAVNLPFWLYWAAVTPVAVALARRYPLSGPTAVRSLLVHLAASVVAALGHAAVTAGFAVWLVAPTGQLSNPSFGAQFQPLVEGYLLLEMFVYWMILGVTQAFMFHRRLVSARVDTARAEARAARSEILAAEAQLQALRMEVDPHFLFNAMNAVSGLVRTGDSAGATDMLARIGDLLRVTLRYGREKSVTLGRELDFVREYLAIESVRIGDRLSIDIQSDPDLLQVRVPPLLLQPLVENAIRHGIAPVPGPARVGIRVARRGDEVVIEVLDSGPGPVEGWVAGTGLSNVRARIEGEYEGRGHLEVGRGRDGGGRIVVRLPAPTVGAA